ncbi:MAG: hypothetical protein WDN46_04485 [Methylocella sp.]
MGDDKAVLVAALESAVRAFRAAYPNPTLLGPSPDQTVLEPLAAAIEQCKAYKAVAGQVVFSGGSGPVLHAGSLASVLFSRGGWPTENVAGAVDWLLKLLGTRKATILVKAAIWGLQVDQPVALGKTAQLTSFTALSNSYMKGRIQERARACYDGSAWMTPTYYDLPDAAYAEAVDEFPYIGGDGAAFQRMNDLEERLKRHRPDPSGGHRRSSDCRRLLVRISRPRPRICRMGEHLVLAPAGGTSSRRARLSRRRLPDSVQHRQL